MPPDQNIFNHDATHTDSNLRLKKSKESGFWSELVKFLFWALIIVIPFRLFIAQPFLVNGASMDPTFATGDYLIVDQVTYEFSEPKRGDVIILKYPRDPDKFFIKRVIGLPNETVRIRNGLVTITNEEHPTGLSLTEPYVKHSKDEWLDITLSPDEYYVLGDNRAGSSDSRVWGALPADNVIGRPILRLFPLKALGIFPGSSNLETNIQ